MEKIVIDANVLYSNTLRGLFLWLSWRGLFAVVWTREIWEEIFRNYSADPEREKTFRAQAESGVFVKFQSSMCILKSDFIQVGLPDANDEHVVALARQEGVRTIVTFNLKDFPDEKLKPHGVNGSHPDSYLCDLLQRQYDAVTEAVSYHIKANHVTKPKKKMYFESLRKTEVKEFVKKLEAADAAGNLFPDIWV